MCVVCVLHAGDRVLFRYTSAYAHACLHSSVMHCMYTLVTHVVGCSMFPSLPVSRAARAKLQRLEKENHQLEKTVATLRHAQAKAEELEKANKRLNGAAHDSRREIIKLKGVGTVNRMHTCTYARTYVARTVSTNVHTGRLVYQVRLDIYVRKCGNPAV